MIEHDKERGLIRPEINAELVADMIYTLIWKQYFPVGFNEGMLFKKSTRF